MATFPHTKIGRCIYCGSTKPPLTREHVMPRGLGGDVAPTGNADALVLQQATCEKCREITCQVEEACLKQHFGPLRVRLEMVRKDRRKPTSRVHVTDREGRKAQIDADNKHLLGAMCIPAFRTAKVVSPNGRTRGPDLRAFWPRPAAPFPDPSITSVGVELRVDVPMFARMLAKIAHGVAVARLGPDGFVPLVCDLILGRSDDYQKFVGGFADEVPKPAKSKALHHVHLRLHDIFWIADLQLFADEGGPINYVVVGMVKGSVTTTLIR